MAHSGYTELLAQQCRMVKLPAPVLELRFAAPRRWRFDLAWEAERLAVEVDGGIWKGGRHTRGQGYENDCVKFAEAVIRGCRGFGVFAKKASWADDRLRQWESSKAGAAAS